MDFDSSAQRASLSSPGGQAEAKGQSLGQSLTSADGSTKDNTENNSSPGKSGTGDNADNDSDAGSAKGGESSPAEKAKVEKVFENFLARCSEDIEDRRMKRVALLDTYKKNTMSECTFQPKITHRGESAPQTTKDIGHSLYYRGLLQSQARLERQKKRLEEVVQQERDACPFKPNSVQEIASQYVEFVRTPRMTTPQPTPRKEPLRLDLSEELNQNARDARDLYRQDPRHQKTKDGYLDASNTRFRGLINKLQEAIDSNAPPEGNQIEQGAFSSPLGAVAEPTEKRLSFSERSENEGQERRESVKRGSILKNPLGPEADDK
eukprot:gnl/MRDRNA2_/MRDRNA2_86442_c0_seq6.p1 gnl/MRDRNA2_/MRDRNA2_86442_c0~~gnl/MRDRNA2_/MRDRNA2_86442_c0_seq6.p1  ORF type:complete len:321 (+),score=74.42 gnl/MRDRNA2_/MRDRNA2_86442_c0_seq6:80-1042(+)